MRKLLLRLALSFPLAMVAAGSGSAQETPAAQQKPPATFEQYPYRPACRQLTAAPGGAPGWFAWGPTIEGKHQNWRGIEANVASEKAYERLASVGLCVMDGELVPWSDLSSDEEASHLEKGSLSTAQRNVEQLKSAPANPSDDDAFAQFVFVGVLAMGGLLLWEKIENAPWIQRLAGGLPADFTSSAFTHTPPSYAPVPTVSPPSDTSEIPQRISAESLAELPNAPTVRTALEMLIASPFISRAVYGAQRAGKTNLVAAVMQILAEKGVKVFVINLSSVNVGHEDSIYWDSADIRSVRGDLETIDNPDEAAKLIGDAILLIGEFMREPEPSILIVDEWAAMTASHAEYVDLLAPLIKKLAAKITAFSSSGMKREKALWTIAPEIVAGTMEDFGKAVKKLSLCLVAIAPGHTESWNGQELSFNWELYGQCSKNYVGLTPPPADFKESRIVYLDSQWVALGTESLVSVQVTVADKAIPTSTTALPPVEKVLSPEITTFREWLDTKVGETISYKSFNNANKLKPLGRSRENYDLYCDKGVMKGWLIPKLEDTYFVLE